jgi:hypothetical protein
MIKYIFHFICHEIIDILKIENTINYYFDSLNNTKCILYSCIQKMSLLILKITNPL